MVRILPFFFFFFFWLAVLFNFAELQMYPALRTPFPTPFPLSITPLAVLSTSLGIV